MIKKEYGKVGDRLSNSTLFLALCMLPHVLKSKWWFYIDDLNEDWSGLTNFGKFLSGMVFAHAGVTCFKGKQKEEYQRNTNRKRISLRSQLQC